MNVIYNSLKFQDYFYITFIHEFKGEKKKTFIYISISFFNSKHNMFNIINNKYN